MSEDNKNTKTEEVENTSSTQAVNENNSFQFKLNLERVAFFFTSFGFLLGVVASMGIFIAAGGVSVGAPTVDNPELDGQEEDTQAADGQADSGELPSEISLEDVHTLGNPDSSVTMVEYSSMTCPFCGRHHEQTNPQLMEDYVDTDEIQFVYKHFARNDLDVQAANAAECAGEQGQFFEYVDVVFENQDDLQADQLEVWAEELGLDMDDWRECQDNLEFEEKIQEQTDEARSIGITGTPGFMINGQEIEGAQPYNAFQTVIEDQL